jgi:hypothetical protein
MTMKGDALAIDGGVPVRARPYDTEKGLNYLSEDEEVEAVTAVMRSRSLFRYYGPDLLGRTEAFERRLAELLGVRHAVGVSSGTAALQCGLVGLGVEDGDEVIVPSSRRGRCPSSRRWTSRSTSRPRPSRRTSPRKRRR